MPVRLPGAARPIAVVAARHHVANARLLVAVVVVVGNEDVAEAVHARLIVIAEIVRDQFEVLAVEIAAPDGAALAIGMVGRPLAALAIGALEIVDTLVADAQIELAIRSDQDAVYAMIVIDAVEAAKQFFRRPVSLAIAVFVLEKQNVRRMADVNFVARPDRFLGHGDS